MQRLRQLTTGQDTHNMETIKAMIRSNNWNVIYRKAQKEYEALTTIRSPQNYYTTFIEEGDDSHQKNMTKQATTFMVE